MEKKVDKIKFELQCELCSCTEFWDLGQGDLCCVGCGHPQDRMDLESNVVTLEEDLMIDFED